MVIRIKGLTDGGLPVRRPGASNPPNAAEGRLRRETARINKLAREIYGTDPAPHVAEDGVIFRPGTNGPDEIQVQS